MIKFIVFKVEETQAQAWTEKREQSQGQLFSCFYMVPPEFLQGALGATGGAVEGLSRQDPSLFPHTLHSL